MVPEHPDGDGNERQDKEGPDPATGHGGDLASSTPSEHVLWSHRRSVDGACLVVEELAEIAVEIVHRSSPWAIVVRNVSEPRATSDLTAATLHPSTPAVSFSDKIGRASCREGVESSVAGG